MTAGTGSPAANCGCSSSTWSDSASDGSQAAASFSSTSPSLPANGVIAAHDGDPDDERDPLAPPPGGGGDSRPDGVMPRRRGGCRLRCCVHGVTSLSMPGCPAWRSPGPAASPGRIDGRDRVFQAMWGRLPVKSPGATVPLVRRFTPGGGRQASGGRTGAGGLPGVVLRAGIRGYSTSRSTFLMSSSRTRRSVTPWEVWKPVGRGFIGRDRALGQRSHLFARFLARLGVDRAPRGQENLPDDDRDQRASGRDGDRDEEGFGRNRCRGSPPMRPDRGPIHSPRLTR